MRMVHRGSDNGGLTVNSTHLISICMTSNDDGFLPTGDETRDVLADDGLSEDSTPQDVPDGPVRRLPHLFQLELCIFV